MGRSKYSVCSGHNSKTQMKKITHNPIEFIWGTEPEPFILFPRQQLMATNNGTANISETTQQIQTNQDYFFDCAIANAPGSHATVITGDNRDWSQMLQLMNQIRQIQGTEKNGPTTKLAAADVNSGIL